MPKRRILFKVAILAAIVLGLVPASVLASVSTRALDAGAGLELAQSGTGAVVTGATVVGLFGILVGVRRGPLCDSAKDCFKADEEIGCGGVFVAALAAMVTGSFVEHQDKGAGFPVVVITFLVSVPVLFVAAFVASYLRWSSAQADKADPPEDAHSGNE